MTEETKDKQVKDVTATKKWRKLVFLPYFLGLLWTCLHPIVSVLTGEFKCRGSYLDENAIDIKHTKSKVVLSKTTGTNEQYKTLCDGLATNNNTVVNLSCYTHADSFQMATVVPLSNAIDPTNEAVVFVIAPPKEGNNWSNSKIHASYIRTLQRLANPVETPWLAKTFILISPTTNDSSSSSSLEDTVTDFLDAYLGSKQKYSRIPPLPPQSCKAILRNLIVIDIHDQSSTSTKAAVSRTQQTNMINGQTDFSILPQGRRGALPNLDLVNLLGKIFGSTSFIRSYSGSTFLAHGYTKQSKTWNEYLQTIFPPQAPTTTSTWGKKAQQWANDMVNLGLFAYTMAIGPFPPHWPALDRGIDSVTIQASFRGVFNQDPTLRFMECLETALRSLSNLHERLHHSFVLYWMPSPDKFVSHMEYFLPNVLVLVPLATRALGMIANGGEIQLHLGAIGFSILVTISTMVSMLFISLGLDAFDRKDDFARTNTCFLIFIVGILYVLKTKIVPDCKQEDEEKAKRIRSSFQFTACATAAYILAPIAFAHAALAYVPSMLLVPLIAFPNYGGKMGKFFLMFLCVTWFVTLPPILLVPRILDTYTTFLRYAYIPLHVQVLLLIISNF